MLGGIANRSSGRPKDIREEKRNESASRRRCSYGCRKYLMHVDDSSVRGCGCCDAVQNPRSVPASFQACNWCNPVPTRRSSMRRAPYITRLFAAIDGIPIGQAAGRWRAALQGPRLWRCSDSLVPDEPQMHPQCPSNGTNLQIEIHSDDQQGAIMGSSCEKEV